MLHASNAGEANELLTEGVHPYGARPEQKTKSNAAGEQKILRRQALERIDFETPASQGGKDARSGA